MIKILKFRQEDYWLIGVSALTVVFIGFFLYAGTFSLRLLSALLGFSGLLFTTYVIRRGYSKQRSYAHITICLVASVALAYGAFLLTN